MPQIIFLMILAFSFVFNELVNASTPARGTTFSATVEDGTPKVIRMKKTRISEESSEEREEQLESLAPTTPKVTRAESRIQERPAHIQREKTPEPIQEASSTEDSTLRPDEMLSMNSSEMPDTDLKTELKQLSERLTALETKPVPTAAAVVIEGPKPTVEAAKVRTAGERIPSDKIDDVAKRLKYAQKIVEKFGIAYDYRSMTVSDFKRIYKKLSTQAAN